MTGPAEWGRSTEHGPGQGGAQVAALARLGQVSKLYEELVIAFRAVAIKAARSEAGYRRIRAEAIVRFAIKEGLPASKAEPSAEADPLVAAACLEYKVDAAEADACRARLIQLREQMAVGRSVLVTDREADKVAMMSLPGRA